MERFYKGAAVVGLAVSLIVAVVVGAQLAAPGEEPVERSYSCLVYTEQGCAKMVVASGGEIEMQSGSTLDIQSGTTSTYGGDVTVTGALDVSGATTLNSTLDADGATTLNSTLDADGATTLNSTLDVDGNITSGTGAVTVTDVLLVDGAADGVQLTVQGYTTQTNSLLVLEQSDGTDALTVSNAGNADVVGTLQYGANNLYPVGFASSGQQAVYGSSLVTSTLAAPHGLTTVTFCVASLGEDPETGGGDAAAVSVTVSGNVCTLKTWQDDFTAATETDVVVLWLVIGAP